MPKINISSNSSKVIISQHSNAINNIVESPIVAIESRINKIAFVSQSWKTVKDLLQLANLLQETGDYLLQETGDRIYLETL